MKILSISTQKPHSTGSGTYLTQMVNVFDTMGYEQIVVAGVVKEDKIRLPKKVKFEGVYYKSDDIPFPVVGMSDSMPYENTRYKDLDEKMQKQLEDAFIKKIDKIINIFNPDLIICHHLYFLTAIIREYFKKRKIVAICHGTDLRQLQKIEFQNDRIINSLRKLDHIFALHDAQLDDIKRIINPDINKISIIGTGYNSDVFYDMKLKRDNRIRIIYAGKLCYKKGVMSFLKAINRMNINPNKICFALAGGYSCNDEYKEIIGLIKNSKYEVELLGMLSQKELAIEMNKSHIFILPSFFEGLPLVLIEALATGLKVISTNVPGVKRWIDDNIQDNNISYINLPELKNVDEVSKESLIKFEEEIAISLEKEIIDIKKHKNTYTKNASWNSVCERLIKNVF